MVRRGEGLRINHDKQQERVGRGKGRQPKLGAEETAQKGSWE